MKEKVNRVYCVKDGCCKEQDPHNSIMKTWILRSPFLSIYSLFGRKLSCCLGIVEMSKVDTLYKGGCMQLCDGLDIESYFSWKRDLVLNKLIYLPYFCLNVVVYASRYFFVFSTQLVICMAALLSFAFH